MNFKKIIDYIIKIIIATIFGFSLVYPIITTLHFSFSPFMIFGLIFTVLIVYSVIFMNKFALKVSIPLIFTSVLCFILYSFFLRRDLLNNFTDSFIWMYDYINRNQTYVNLYSFVITIFLTITISLIVFIFTMKKFNFIVILLFGSIIYVSQWMLNYFMDEAIISLYLFVFSIIIYYFVHINNKKYRFDTDNSINSSSFMLSVLPVCILVLIISLTIPVKPTPIEWPWLDTKIAYAVKYFHNIYGKSNLSDAGYFSLSSAGFGNAGNTLGGNITPDDTKVLNVVGPNNLYLRGRSSDLYNGNSWVNTSITNDIISSNSNKMNFDIHEMKSGLNFLINRYASTASEYPQLSASSLPNFVWKENVNITFHDIKTKSLFVPLKSEYFFFSNIDKNSIAINPDGIFSSSKALSKRSNYSFETYRIKYSDSLYENIMQYSEKGLYTQELSDISQEIYDNIYSDYIESKLDNHGVKIIEEAQDIQEVQDIPEVGIEEVDLRNFEGIAIFPSNQFSNHNISFNDSITAWSQYNINELNNIIFYSTSSYDLKQEISSYLLTFLDNESGYKNRRENNDDMSFLENEKYTKLFNDRDNIITLINNSEDIYTNFLTLPETLPKRVRTLAQSITRDKTNNYNKVKAIEQYLSNNYSYTLNPGDTPKERDFVDYFLFDIKSGYCTYFASSMAILTRCIGIPSRYIEGYILPSTPNDKYIFEVTNQQAHAWVEVYFEGIGWITVEPTASFGNSFYSIENRKSNSYSGSAPYRPDFDTNNTGNRNNLVISPSNNDNETSDMMFRIALYTLSVIIVLLSFVVLLNSIKRNLKFRNIRKKGNKQSIIHLYEYFLKHLNYQGNFIKSGETPIEYAHRLDKHGCIHPYKFKEITDIFIKARYTQIELTESEKAIFYMFYNSIFKITKLNLGKIKYFIITHIMGKM